MKRISAAVLALSAIASQAIAGDIFVPISVNRGARIVESGSSIVRIGGEEMSSASSEIVDEHGTVLAKSQITVSGCYSPDAPGRESERVMHISSKTTSMRDWHPMRNEPMDRVAMAICEVARRSNRQAR